jgi:glycosyltransferase involved in cell wall biosynthesis
MLSVVVCAKDEADRIEGCLRSLLATGEVGELIVVIGGEPDNQTASIARRVLRRSGERFMVVTSDSGSLPVDRQLGIDLAGGDWVALVDADHRIKPGDLTELVNTAAVEGWAIAQAGLSVMPQSFWNRAESSFLALTHNTPGQRDMVGVAPAVFHRDLFRLVRFAESGTGGGDDTDLLYRLARDTDLRVGIAPVVVETVHAPRLADYVRKFRWYGTADAQFARTYPERRRSMLFHLLVRYPVIHPARAIAAGHFRAAPYAVLQGLVRASCFIRT